jgi:hypothetical protein
MITNSCGVRAPETALLRISSLEANVSNGPRFGHQQEFEYLDRNGNGVVACRRINGHVGALVAHLAP